MDRVEGRATGSALSAWEQEFLRVAGFLPPRAEANPEAGADADASPEVDADATPPVAPVDDPESGGESDEPGLEAPIDPDEIPEEFREYYDRVDKQFKSAYTRARQKDREELQQQLSEFEEGRELLERLNDPNQALDALNELAEKLGYEPNDDPEDGESEGEAGEGGEDDELRQQIQELTEAEKARQEERRRTLIRDHIDDGLDAFEEKLQTDLPQDTRELATFAALSYPGQDGLPAIDHVIELIEAHDAAVIERYVQSKRNAPDAPDASGGSGVSQLDTSTPEGRLAAAMKVAERHLGSN